MRNSEVDRAKGAKNDTDGLGSDSSASTLGVYSQVWGSVVVFSVLVGMRVR